MASGQPLAHGAGLQFPPSSSTVSVSVIDTTSSIRGVDASRFVSPRIEGHKYLGAPSFSFLIEHVENAASGGGTRRLIFDLGIRKDWWNSSPFLQGHFKKGGYQINVDKSVREILEENGTSCEGAAIEAVIWSHWHWDHTGNPDEFPPSTKLIVGPGFKANLLPGYPANPDSPILESNYSRRDLQEISFDDSLKIGGFRAHDYFGDGSFYLLDSPGHAIGHLCGLARVTSAPASFIFMGGDIAHHAGEWRPSTLLPLPEQVTPHPFKPLTSPICACPGAMFEHLGVASDHRGSSRRTEAFYEPAKLESGQVHLDVDECISSIHKMQEFDGQSDENVLVVVAHDESMLDVLDFFPKTVNDFLGRGIVQRVRWRFLRDFAMAVGWQEPIEGKRNWTPAAQG